MGSLSIKQIIALVGFILILVSIPLASLLVKQTQIFKSSASGAKTQNTTKPANNSSSQLTKALEEVPANSPLNDLKKLLEESTSSGEGTPSGSTPDLTPSPTPAVNITFGPTLNMKISIEGRPTGKQAAKVFIGLASGTATNKPSYTLTYTIDFPDSGEFKGMSLAGLTPGSTYTAYVKGPSQIDSASTFVMGPTETNLNNDQALLLLSGDLNEDNTINSLDYDIAKNLYGVTPTWSTWNERADINADQIINNIDISLIIKNMGKTGASSTWYSSNPISSPSASLNISPNNGGPSGGYWLWMPPQ